MAIVKNFKYDGSLREIVGLSSDTKPTTDIPQGSLFRELDIGVTYTFHGTTWYPHNQLLTYREAQATAGHTWMENFMIDVGNDIGIDIDTAYVTLSKIGVHTIAGSNTLVVVNKTGFTGDMYTTYDIEVTKSGASGTAEFKWRSKTQVGSWLAYTTGVVTAADNDLGDNVVLNWTGVTSAVADQYYAHGKPSWHKPASGYRSYLTSFIVRMLDVTPSAKLGFARLSQANNEVWEALSSSYSSETWRTPLYILGDGTLKYEFEFKEVVKGDIEYV